MEKTIPAEVLEHAHSQGFYAVSYEGDLDGAEVYSVGNLDKEGNPIPSGLPSLVLFKDGKTEFECGLEGLELLRRLRRLQ